jgi:hypothetical protein
VGIKWMGWRDRSRDREGCFRRDEVLVEEFWGRTDCASVV